MTRLPDSGDYGKQGGERFRTNQKYPAATDTATGISLSFIFASKDSNSSLAHTSFVAAVLLSFQPVINGFAGIHKPDLSELMDVFDAIQKRVHEVYKDAPNTTNKAVKKADAALKKHKEGTYTEEEIDALLPEELKRRSEK